MLNNHHPSADLDLKLLVVLMRAHRSVTDRVLSDMKSHGLNPTEFMVLELLYHKGDQPIQQIGKRVLLASGSITYVVDKLEEKSYLSRRRCTEDRRVIYATLTDKGRQLMDEIFPKHHEAISNMFSGLQEKEKESLVQLLKKLGYSL